MIETKATPDVVSTDAIEFVKQLANGSVAHDFAAETERVVKAVVETVKPGKVTLTIEIAPLKDSVQQLAVQGKVTSSIPKQTEISVFFPTRNGTLSRKNPNQMEFDDMK